MFSWLTAALVSVREGREVAPGNWFFVHHPSPFCFEIFYIFSDSFLLFWRSSYFLNVTSLSPFFSLLHQGRLLRTGNVAHSCSLFSVMLVLKHAVWCSSFRAITMMIKATLIDKEIWWWWWWWRYSQFWEVPLVVSHASRLKNCMLLIIVIIISIFSFILTFNIIVIITFIGLIITVMILTIYVIIIILTMMIMIIVSYSGRTIIANSISNMAAFAL